MFLPDAPPPRKRRSAARPWTDRSGNLKAGLELVADTLEFMSSRQDGQQRPDDDVLEF